VAELLDRLSKAVEANGSGEHEAYEQGRRLLRMLDDLKSGVAKDGHRSWRIQARHYNPICSESGLTGPLDTLRAEFSRPRCAGRIRLVAQPGGTGEPQMNSTPPRSACRMVLRLPKTSSATIWDRNPSSSWSRAR